jgi:hypothetical protein
MTKFQFSLERVLDWRHTQLELEEIKVRQATSALAAVDAAQVDLESAGTAAEVEVRRWAPIAGRDLHALGLYRRHIRSQQDAVAVRRAECVRQLAAQQAAMWEARRSCELLERLRERRLAEWTATQNRELEAVASESYLAQWRPPSKRSSAAITARQS